MRELVAPVALAAHDAGAANLIAGWFADYEHSELRAVFGGPAEAIFTRAWPGLTSMSLDDVLEGARVLVSGTSRLSVIEHDARRLARKKGVPSIAVIDHWVNYPERFERGGVVDLPDTIWVGDEFAAQLAQRHFPTVTVQQKPNAYLDRLVADVRACAASLHGDTRVLYVLEPFRSTWGRGSSEGEFQALDYFLGRLPWLGATASVDIRLRPHPEDPPGKYDAWVAHACTGRRVSVDTRGPLAEAIAWADWVVGGETYAMVVALHAGRRVLSSLPPWGPPCRLPHPGIEQIRHIAE